jgi:hypothetical protein
MTDKMWEEFEDRFVGADFARHANLGYRNDTTQWMWLSWRAAKEFSSKELEAAMQRIADLESLMQQKEVFYITKNAEVFAVSEQRGDTIDALEAEKEALEKKLAEQQALLQFAILKGFIPLCNDGGTEELTKLLAAARKEGFEEGEAVGYINGMDVGHKVGKQAGRDELQKEHEAAQLSFKRLGF